MSRNDSTSARRAGSGGESRVARAWRIATEELSHAFGLLGHAVHPAEPPPAPPKPKRDVKPKNDVDRASEDSFPASDPPAWTSSHS